MEKVETGGAHQGSARRFSSRCHRPHPLSEADALGHGARSSSAGPLHWIVALLGDEIIHFDVAGISSGNASIGHRFLSAGDRVYHGHLAGYLEEMRARYVIADEQERMEMMKAAIRGIEAKTGAPAVADADLLEEIWYITEYPHGLMGTFDEEYLELPEPCS